MSPEEIAAITAVGDALRAAPRPWSALTGQEQSTLRQALMPDPSFTPDQLDYLHRWWLPVTADQLAALNAAAPERMDIAPRPDAAAQLYVSADLLSDALDGRRLAALLPVLSSLVLTYEDTIEWPVAEETSAE